MRDGRPLNYLSIRHVPDVRSKVLEVFARGELYLVRTRYIWFPMPLTGRMEMVTVKLLVDGDVPDVVDSRWCADTFGITPEAVQAAIRDGRISATRFGRLWAIKSEDAMRVWGHRLIRNKT